MSLTDLVSQRPNTVPIGSAGCRRVPMHAAAFIAALLAAVLATSAAVAQGTCLEGCPQGAPATDHVISRPIYVLSNNGETKFATWVAYRITKQTIKQTKNKKRVWKKDPDLAEDETLSPRDYAGARAALQVDRGHQAPLADFTGTKYWPMTNYLSNITPQKSDLNQGAWERLEQAERTLVKQRDVSAVYSATGLLFEREMPKLPKATQDHEIPSGYWKVVAVQQDGELETAAFLMHQNTPRNANFCNYVVTVSEVEQRSGLHFFPKLPREQVEQIETGPGALMTALGCQVVQTPSGPQMKQVSARR